MTVTHIVGGHPATRARRTLCFLRVDDPNAVPYHHAYYIGRRSTEPVYCPDCLEEHAANEATKGVTVDPWPDTVAWAVHEAGPMPEPADDRQLTLDGIR